MHLRNLLPALLILSACAAPETADQAAARIAAESAAARSALDRINVRYARYLNQNQADSVARLFAEDGVMMPPFAPAVEGREAIERGTSTFSLPATGGAPAVSVPGKYLVHWHRVGDQWLQQATIWSDDAPPPAAAS